MRQQSFGVRCLQRMKNYSYSSSMRRGRTASPPQRNRFFGVNSYSIGAPLRSVPLRAETAICLPAER